MLKKENGLFETFWNLGVSANKEQQNYANRRAPVVGASSTTVPETEIVEQVKGNNTELRRETILGIARTRSQTLCLVNRELA